MIGLMAGVVGVSTMGQRVARADEFDAEQPAQAASAQSSASKATFKSLRDPTLAYSFEYPVTSSSGAALPMVVSRKPEKYSSAAPLTADARQRIVCELVSLMDALTVSVSVGPPSGTLRTTKPEDWTAKQLAEQVLLDRSTGRVTSGRGSACRPWKVRDLRRGTVQSTASMRQSLRAVRPCCRVPGRRTATPGQ